MPGIAPPKVAAIDHQVRIGREALADLLKQICVLSRDGFLGQECGAKVHLRFGAFADHVDRIDVGPACQRTGHLLDAVAASVKQNDFDVRVHPAEEFLIVRHGRVDEDDLMARLDRQVSREGLEQLLAVGGGWRLAASTVARHGGFSLFMSHLLLIHLRSGRGRRGIEHQP